MMKKRNIPDLSHTQVSELKEKLTESILKEMRRNALSQGDVAQMVGMSRNNLNKTLRGTERCITINQLIRIANGIGLIINLTTKRKK